MTYREVNEFFHSELSSDPDNQNKQKVRIDMGKDPNTGQQLYDLHERRAQRGTLRSLFAVFRASQFAARLRERTRTPRRPNGVKVGWRQFIENKCPCVQERKASECDCQDCTYIIENLSRWHKARRGWHRALVEKAGGRPCSCRLHGTARLHSAAMDAREAESTAWAHAANAAAEDSGAGEKALCASDWARKQEAIWEVAEDRKKRYDGMSRSINDMLAALLPCGRMALPQYSLTGGSVFKMYPRECAYGNCPKKLFRRASACGWTHQFGDRDCPVEASNDAFTWHVWEMRPRGTSKESGQPSLSPEFVPKHGTRGEFLQEFRRRLVEWIPHFWRDQLAKQGLRVFEDRKSGRALHDAESVHRYASLRLEAFKVVAQVDPVVGWKLLHSGSNDSAAPGTPCAAEVWEAQRVTGTVHVLLRYLREAAAHATKQLDDAASAHSFASRTATIQSDYAAQVETHRRYTATCASRERHNCLVVIVGYKPYRVEQPQGSRRRKQPASEGSAEYRQRVDVFFAFHVAGFKPSARSFNVVREDIDHWLRYGSFRHGEWFTSGQRCPGGDHSQSLPPELTERPAQAPDFPEYLVALDVADGAPTQFANADNYHQVAEWRAKTSSWDDSSSGILRRMVKHEPHHGKSGCDGYSNVPTHAIKDAIRSGHIINPTTREMVLYLAVHKQFPSIPKHMKRGWESADRYFYGFMDSSKFTKFAVPDADAKGWGSKSFGEKVGLCTDRAKAEKEGPLHVRHSFCACKPCICLEFDKCEMMQHVGKMTRVSAPLDNSAATRRPMLESLEEWADCLCAGMLVAVRAGEGEHDYWLAKLLGSAFAVPSSLVHAGDEYEEGWLVVEAQYYDIEQRSPRGFKLLPQKKLLVVNALVRLKGLQFDRSRRSCAMGTRAFHGEPIETRGRGGLEILSEDYHNEIMANL